MAEAGKIYQAIPSIMGELNAIGKNKKNSQQGFMYRGVDDVMNAINPALVKNRVFIVPEIIDQLREERQSARGANLIYSICKMRFKFFAEDGSSVEAVTIGEGMDSGDKATNKAMAIAFKYACFQIFCIPTEEMKDPDAESHNVQPRGNVSNNGVEAQKDGSRRNNTPKQENRPQGGSRQQTADERQMNAEMMEQANGEPVDAVKVKVIRDAIRKKGLSEASILAHYHLGSFEAMTMAHWMNAMQLLERYPDKESGQ